MTSTPRIAVIIACHNRRAKTLACLHSLRAQRVEATLHPIIYDDGSTDGTAEAIAIAHPEATILPGTGAAYWSGGMRAAFDHALRGDFDAYLWLNDDVVLAPDAVARLLAGAGDAAASHRGPILVGGATCDPVTGAFTYGGIARRRTALSPLRFVAVPPAAEPRLCDTLHGNVVLVPRATARTVGSIGPGFVHALGDLDYGLRVGRAGGTVMLAAGYVGACARNPRSQAFFDPATPLGERWRKLKDPLGFPLRPWLGFARAHGGRFWPVWALLPYVRLALPSRLDLAWRTRRSRAHAA